MKRGDDNFFNTGNHGKKTLQNNNATQHLKGDRTACAKVSCRLGVLGDNTSGDLPGRTKTKCCAWFLSLLLRQSDKTLVEKTKLKTPELKK